MDIDPFYQVGQEYKHLGYKEIFVCTGFTKSHAVFKGSFELHVPYIKRHMFMYKKINLSLG